MLAVSKKPFLDQLAFCVIDGTTENAPYGLCCVGASKKSNYNDEQESCRGLHDSTAQLGDLVVINSAAHKLRNLQGVREIGNGAIKRYTRTLESVTWGRGSNNSQFLRYVIYFKFDYYISNI